MAAAVAHEYTLYCVAQSGNCDKVALALELAGAGWGPRFVAYFGGGTRAPAYPNIRDWLARIQAERRWVHPYELMPGYQRPQAA